MAHALLLEHVERVAVAQYQAAIMLRADDIPSVADARERFDAALIEESKGKHVDPAQAALRRALGVS